MTQGELSEYGLNEQPLPLVLRVVETSDSSPLTPNESYEINDHFCLISDEKFVPLSPQDQDPQDHICEIVRNPAGTYVRDLADQLCVNGQRLHEAWLHQGDLIQLGDLSIQVKKLGVVSWQSIEAPAHKSPSDLDVKHDEPSTDQIKEQNDATNCVDNDCQTDIDAPRESNDPNGTDLGMAPNQHTPVSDEDDSATDQHSEDQISIQPTSENPQPTDAEDEIFWTDDEDDESQSSQWQDEFDGQATESTNEPIGIADRQTEAADNFPTSPDSDDTQPVSDWLPINDDTHQFSTMTDSTDDKTDKVREPSIIDEAGPEDSETTMNNQLDEDLDDADGQTPEDSNPAPAQANESVAEVLARLQQAGQLSDLSFDAKNDIEIPLAECSETPVETDTTTASNESAPTTSSSPNATDGSVQDYMSGLFERLRGPGAEPMPVPEAQVVTQDVDPKPSMADEESLEQLKPASPLKASEYKPRQSATIQQSTMDALRQVANQSTNTAIQESVKQKKDTFGFMYFGGAGISLIISVVFFALSHSWFDISFILATLAAISCAGLSFMFFRMHVDNETAIAWFKDKLPAKRPPATGQKTVDDTTSQREDA